MMTTRSTTTSRRMSEDDEVREDHEMKISETSDKFTFI